MPGRKIPFKKTSGRRLVSVQQAEALILKGVNLFPPVCGPISKAFGLVLREDLIADRDLPPFNRVAMDGIAIHFSSWQKGRREFTVEGVQKAGTPVLTLKDRKSCIEVMTGAVLPLGCDCVTPVESMKRVGTAARLQENFKAVKVLNVHPQGADHRQKDRLARAGCRLLSPQIAVAASIGKKDVLVSRMPAVAVVATGDELVEVDKIPAPYQIRQSNVYALQAALYLQGYTEVDRFHVLDNKNELRRRLRGILQKFDVIILSGGVSMGKFDFVPQVLSELGVKAVFHKVRQRPGKPFWFGKTKDGRPVFALPGNPVSTHISMYRYVFPFLSRAAGLKTAAEKYAVLGEDVDISTALTYFLPVRLISSRDGRMTALPVFLSGSGDYASLARSDGFIELPQGAGRFPKAGVHRFYPWFF